MYYIIQENLYREYHFKTLLEYLQRYSLEYEIIKFKPFVSDLEFKTTRKDVWLFGSPNSSLVAKQYNWTPGSMYNENHDIEVYGKYYGQHMLNHDGFIIEIGDELPVQLPYAFFARPTKDTKNFSGQLFTKDSWAQWISDLTDSNEKQGLRKETKVHVAPLKTIQQEIRCWIVDGEPVTMSQYKIGSRVNYLNMDHNEETYIFSKKMAKLYSPARAFVIDICLHEDEYKVVEINCANCSGFYDLNMSKLLQALEEAFQSKCYCGTPVDTSNLDCIEFKLCKHHADDV